MSLSAVSSARERAIGRPRRTCFIIGSGMRGTQKRVSDPSPSSGSGTADRPPRIRTGSWFRPAEAAAEQAARPERPAACGFGRAPPPPAFLRSGLGRGRRRAVRPERARPRPQAAWASAAAGRRWRWRNGAGSAVVSSCAPSEACAMRRRSRRCRASADEDRHRRLLLAARRCGSSTVPSAAGKRNGVGAASGAASSPASRLLRLARALRSMSPESSCSRVVEGADAVIATGGAEDASAPLVSA